MADRFASQGYSLKNKLGDWIKQLLNSVIAKYRDLSVSRRSIICRSRIIDLLATNKSRYFAQPRPIIVKSLHIYIKSMHLSIILSRLIFAINRGACLWGETGGCFFEKYLLFHLSGYNNDQLVLKQWKGALNRFKVLPPRHDLLKNSNLALRARSLLLCRPRSLGIWELKLRRRRRERQKGNRFR